METKERPPQGGRKPSAGKRPVQGNRPGTGKTAQRSGAASGKRPARPAGSPAARPAGNPAAGSRPARPAGVRAPAKKAAPKKGLFRKAPRKPVPKATDAGYTPYQAANRKKSAKKNAAFAQRISKFFSVENPLVRLFYNPEPEIFGDGTGKSQKQKAAEARKKKLAEMLHTPAIIYTDPKPFSRSRLAMQLLTVLATVLALVMGVSVFFKVRVITVTGAKVYSAWTIREKSGIEEGANLLTFGRTRASGQIIANLPYVKSARIGIKLPDTVNIEIEEADVVYAIQDQDSVWWLINSLGKVVEPTDTASSKNYTRILGVNLTGTRMGEQAVAWEPEPTETDADGNFVPQLVSNAVRLNAALEIIKALEANDIVGQAASIDVTRIEDIILWYGTQYQVALGNTMNMEYKIACMNDVILQMSDYQTGILDVSFNLWTDQVIYTPFG